MRGGTEWPLPPPISPAGVRSPLHPRFYQGCTRTLRLKCFLLKNNNLNAHCWPAPASGWVSKGLRPLARRALRGAAPLSRRLAPEEFPNSLLDQTILKKSSGALGNSFPGLASSTNRARDQLQSITNGGFGARSSLTSFTPGIPSPNARNARSTSGERMRPWKVMTPSETSAKMR
jgi:hypothetical protein